MKYVFLFVLAFIMIVGNLSGRTAPGPAMIVSTDTVPSGVPQLFGGKYYQFKGYILIDSLLLMPCADTNFIPNKPALVYKCTDSTFYLWTQSRWKALLREGDVEPFDTTTLSNRIELKLNIADTSAMLANYIRDGGYGLVKVGQLLRADTGATGLATQYDISQIVSGINQLTGDVTAGPGTGSQAATIAANAVSNTKFRQSVATSVVGRADNSTGNVDDIQGTTQGEYLKRGTNTLEFDSVAYTEIKNTPPVFPGLYIAPFQSFNPGFLVLASGIVRPSNTFSHGTPITWEFLTSSTAHNYSFFDSVYGHASNARLVVRYPAVKNVLNLTITPDETFSSQAVIMGPSVGLTTAETPVYRFYSIGIRLTGAGTTTWTENSGLGLTGNFDMSTYNTADGSTSFNVTSTFGTDYNALSLTYIGANNYHIRRTYSGLGAYSAKFHLVDEFNNPVTSNPTTTDEVIISNAGMFTQQIGMTTWNAVTNSWMGSTTNFWITGLFEAWLVAAPISSTSIQVRWQTSYPSATNYKIYRSTSLYGTYTLIHTGTEGIVTDAGLSANTVYYYKMIAVIGGVDTEITTFRTNTYF